MSDHPFMDVVNTAEELVKKGVTVFQKFSCDNCNSRQTIDVPNQFYTTGLCEECGHVTDIKIKGCNYIAVGSTNGGNEALLEHMYRGKKD